MNQPDLLCLSLTTNLRCVGLTLGQLSALVIPQVIETIISLLFIYSLSGPSRRAQILLAADTILYFTWALLDMLSHTIPAARNSLSVFEALDFLVGAASFTPILVYSVYLYRLSFRAFIPTLPRNLRPCLEISLPILLVIAVVINEASSFAGVRLGKTSNRRLIVEFPNNSDTLWLSLSQSSLAIYTVVQFLYFLLAFSRLCTALLDQRRIELAHSDENHFFRGIAWVNVGVMTGVIETISGFARMSFSVAFARRILRLAARSTLMFGLLKGLDFVENFENIADELRGTSRIDKRVSHMLDGVDFRRTSVFRRISQTCPEQSEQCTSSEKQSGNQRVTAHCEKGQAPFLQIRFSRLDFPVQTVLTDTRRRSLSTSVPGYASSSARQPGKRVSDEMAAARNAVLDMPRAKSALVLTDNNFPPDWIRPPEECRTRQGSGGTVSDNLSVIRDLELKFPNLPPRVTGKYRGSILGQNYEEDPFPVVGVSRQSSVRQDRGAQSASEEGGASVTLTSSGSIKRKPAPPLLDNITYILDRNKRPASAWGGLTQNTVNYPLDSPAAPNSPWESTTVYGSDPALAGEPGSPCTPKSRRRTARDLIKRASRALSDASIRSAEWFASASSPKSTRTPLTPMDIEMYRRGSLGPGSARPKPGIGENSSGISQITPRHITDRVDTTNTGRLPRMTPTPTPTEPARYEHGHGSVNPPDDARSKTVR